MKVIGIERRKGIFQEKPYDSTRLHLIKPIKDDVGKGFAVESVKLKTVDIRIDLKLDDEIIVYYDAFKNPIGIDYEY